MRYKIYIFKGMCNPIPDILTLYYRDCTTAEDIRDIVGKNMLNSLDGNAIPFMTETGKLFIYDRCQIRKIIVKQIKD